MNDFYLAPVKINIRSFKISFCKKINFILEDY